MFHIDPQAFYETVVAAPGSGSGGLQPILDQLVGDPLKTLLDAVDGVAKAPDATTPPPYVAQLQQLLGASDFVEIDIAPLADLLKLFDKNIGSVSGGTLTLDAEDIIFLPLAIVLWTTVYMREGKIVSSVDQLDDSAAAPEGAVQGYTLWDAARLGVDYTLSELIALAWLITATVPETDRTDGQKQFLFVSSWLSVCLAVNDFAYSFGSTQIGATPSTTPKGLTYTYVAERMTASVIRGVATLKENSTTVNATNLADSIMFLVLDAYEAYALVEEWEKNPDDPPTADTVAFAGRVMARTQKLARTFWAYFGQQIAAENPNTVDAFAVVIFVTPVGNLVQEVALTLPNAPDTTPPPPPGTDNPKRKGPPPGRPRRPGHGGGPTR